MMKFARVLALASIFGTSLGCGSSSSSGAGGASGEGGGTASHAASSASTASASASTGTAGACLASSAACDPTAPEDPCCAGICTEQQVCGCADDGYSCRDDKDCCDGLRCFEHDHGCVAQDCHDAGETCTSDGDCCPFFAVCLTGQLCCVPRPQAVCTKDSECCTGKCQDQGDGTKQCACSAKGGPCATDDDCCGGTCDPGPATDQHPPTGTCK